MPTNSTSLGRINTGTPVGVSAGRIGNSTNSSAGRINSPSAPAPSYFYNKFPSGATLGRSDQLDVSGKPFLGYRNPGDNATSTDTTRVATTFNPTTPSVQEAQTFKTPRQVNDRAQVKSSLGGSYSDELDHQIALELAGSNDKSNLAIQPGRINGQAKTSDNLETHLAHEVASGKMSLFDAQSQLAKSKGAKTPWTPPQDNPDMTAVNNTPFTDKARAIIKNSKISYGNPDQTSASGENTNGNIIVAKGSGPTVISHELFHSFFADSKIDPDKFNEDFEKAVKKYPEIARFDDSLNKGGYNLLDTHSLATERFAYLGSVAGNDGLSNIPESLQKYYAPYLKNDAVSGTGKDFTSVASAVGKGANAVGNFLASPLTESARYAAKAVAPMVKPAVQSFMQAGAQPGISLGNAINKARGIAYQSELPAPKDAVGKFIFGNEPIKDPATVAAEREQGIQSSPLANRLGLSKFATPLALGSVAGEGAMNFLGGEGKAAEEGADVAKGILSESAIKKIPQAIREEAVNLYNAVKKIGSSGKPNIELEGKINDFMAKAEKGAVTPSDLMDAREAHFQAKGNQVIPLKSVSPADKLIAEGKIKVQSINNKDTYFYKDPKGEWKRSIGEDNAVRMATKPSSALPQDLVERKTALEIQKDELKNNPLNNLTKYQARRGEFKGQLPEITGNSKGTFGRKGDTILTEHLGNIDSETARAKYEKFTENKARLAEEEANLKQDIQNHKNSLKFSSEGIPLAKTKAQIRSVPEGNRIRQPLYDTPGSTSRPPKTLEETTPQTHSEKASSPKYTETPTKNKVEYKITGSTGKERVESAIANHERAQNEISIKGKSAYTLGRKFGNPELKVFRDKYQAGVPIDEIASKSSNPGQAKKYLNEVKDYYDLQLAHDRAAGGQTANEPNHLVQSWNLDNPKDLARFNELATQKGLQPYSGFHAQPKVFKTYAEGEAAGFKPKNANMNEDLLKHSQQASNVISKQVLKKGLVQAAPRDVSMQGAGMTKEGKPFVNSNIKGLEGISYHPSIHSQLKGFESLKNKDVFSLMKDKGFDASKPSTYKKAWEGLKEGGVLNTVSTLYDRSTKEMKQLLLNFSGFHSINVSSNFSGASLFHPLQGAKGLASSVPSFLSEKVTQSIIDGMKSKMVKEQDFSVFDAGLRSGVNMDRGLPAKGLAKLNPMSALGRAIFDRELYTLKLNLVDQTYGSGKVLPESVKGRALGKEINMIMGEMNNRTMNINPNTQKWLSRALLAPQFTESKYKLLGDALTKSGQNGGNLARTAVVGKTLAIGTMATLGTVLATGKFPNLQQMLLNYSINPSSQTNLTNSKGQKQDIVYPKTFITEPMEAAHDPIHYAESRLSPVVSDAISIGTNKDYYGNPVYDKNKPESALSQYGKNVGFGDLPIGVQSVVKQAQGKQSGTETALQLAGLRAHVSPNDQNVQQTNDANQIAQEEKDTRAKLRNEAKAQVETIDALPKEEQQAALEKIAASNLPLAKEIVSVKSQKDLGFTSKDYAIGSLGVLDGARAKFISDQMKKMATEDDRRNYWNELVGKKLITAKVAQEINDIMK